MDAEAVALGCAGATTRLSETSWRCWIGPWVVRSPICRPWKRPSSLQDVLIHADDRVDLEEVWEAYRQFRGLGEQIAQGATPGFQQPLIELRQPHQAQTDGGQHLFFQEGDVLLCLGLLNPGAAQRQITPQPQHHFDGTQGGEGAQCRLELQPMTEKATERRAKSHQKIIDGADVGRPPGSHGARLT